MVDFWTWALHHPRGLETLHEVFLGTTDFQQQVLGGLATGDVAEMLNGSLGKMTGLMGETWENL